MPPSPKAQLRAALLAGSIATPPEPPELLLELQVPAIHRTVRRQAPPLDLDAPRFHYSVSVNGVAHVVREGARVHSSKCPSPHRRSAARA